jgi:hypothetical protein
MEHGERRDDHQKMHGMASLQDKKSAVEQPGPTALTELHIRNSEFRIAQKSICPQILDPAGIQSPKTFAKPQLKYGPPATERE